MESGKIRLTDASLLVWFRNCFDSLINKNLLVSITFQAAEMQAIDRTHRLGQFRPIRAVRFIAEGTVEERVLQLQEKKRLVFDGTVGR